MNQQTSKRRGTSITEILVAIALFSFTIIPLCGMFSGSIRQAEAGEDYVKATFVARKALEEVKYRATIHKNALETIAATIEIPAPDGYHVECQIDTNHKEAVRGGKGSSKVEVAKAEALVQWTDLNGNPRELRLATLLDPAGR